MPKILLCLVLASLSALATAQTPAKPAKPRVQPVAKSSGKTSASTLATAQAQARAAAEATAQVQALAIAQAAASARNLPSAPTQTSSATVQPAANAVLRPTLVMVPAYPAPLALPVSPAHSPAALTPPAAADSASEPTALADQVHQGHLPCEMGASVRVEADIAKPGYFNVMSKGFKYHMHRVRTSTGAIRLEDAKAGVVWLQLANKSMLMDQKKGRRVVDECAHPDQVAYAKSMKTNPPPGLFDTTGMGLPKN